jgi:uncharacterized protein
MNNQEKRFLNSDFEVRKDNDKVVVEGYAARFDDETIIGGKFAERVARGAFDGADMSNTVALFNHDWNMPLARVGKGLELSVDEVGLRYRFELGEQSYAKDLAENIRMGNVSTSSFGFTVADDSWERRDGMNLRTINTVGTLFDVSPTTQGAYPTTEVAIRSMEAALGEEVEEAEVEAPAVPEDVVEEVAEAVAEEVEAADIPENDEEERNEDIAAEEDEAEEPAAEEAEEEEEEEEEEEAEERKVYKVEEAEEAAPKKKKAKKAPAKKEEPKEETINQSEETRNNSISEMENTNTNPAVVQGLGDSEARAAKDFNFGKFLKEAAKGNLTGLEAEMTQEGTNEMRNAGVNVSGGFNIPSMVLRSMGVGAGAAANTAFGGEVGKVDGGIVADYAPNDYAAQLGIRNMDNLVGDVVMQVQGTLTAATGGVTEGATQSEALPAFSPVTLSPARYAAHVGVTQQMLAQSGDDMAAFIQMDIRRALDKSFNAAIITEIEANDTDRAYTSFNPLDIEELLLGADVDLNNVRALSSAGAYRTFRSLSLDAGSGDLFANDPKSRTSIIGYGTAVGSQVGAGKCHFFDKDQIVTGRWGGLNMIVDPYTLAADGVVRIIANEYRDVEVLNSASFQTITGA